jgi:hypothetical protein
MKIFGICLLVVALTAPTFADDKKAKVDEDPIVFGITGQNTGCVIFRQYTEKNTKFWGVAISQSRVSALEVIETQNYELAQKRWVGQDGADELTRLAVKDRLKYVKIPEKYTPSQLQKARAACKESAVPPQPEQPADK